MNWKIVLTTCLGCLLIVLGVALPLVFPTIFEAKLAEKLKILPDSEMLKSFAKTPIPIYFDIYIFNITNTEEMYDGAKPIVTQRGPYVYRQERYKLNISWDHELGTVTYNEQRIYFFEPEKSIGSEDDVFTTLNPVFLSVASKADNLNAVVQGVMSLWTWQFESFQLFMTKTVKELTFGGYDDPVVAELYKMSEKPKYASGKTGFLYPKNGSIAPAAEIFSGELDMDKYQTLYKYNGESKLKYWKRDDCNMINGTFGSQFPKPVSKTKPLYMFSKDLCRSVYLSYDKDTMLGPLTLRRFTLSNEVLESNDIKNCYCSDFVCRNSMVDIAACKDGSPVVMSTPHFYMGDEKDINMIDGLNPIMSEHETYLEIEPNTGVTMRAAKRMQINMALRRYSAFSDFNEVMEVVLPIMWVNENVEVPLARAEALHENLTGPKKMVGYLALAVVTVGVILVLVALLTLCCGKRGQMKVQQRQEMLDKEANKKLLHGKPNEKSKY